jgi:hypothetical protein
MPQPTTDARSWHETLFGRNTSVDAHTRAGCEGGTSICAISGTDSSQDSQERRSIILFIVFQLYVEDQMMLYTGIFDLTLLYTQSTKPRDGLCSDLWDPKHDL